MYPRSLSKVKTCLSSAYFLENICTCMLKANMKKIRSLYVLETRFLTSCSPVHRPFFLDSQALGFPSLKSLSTVKAGVRERVRLLRNGRTTFICLSKPCLPVPLFVVDLGRKGREGKENTPDTPPPFCRRHNMDKL